MNWGNYVLVFSLALLSQAAALLPANAVEEEYYGNLDGDVPGVKAGVAQGDQGGDESWREVENEGLSNGGSDSEAFYEQSKDLEREDKEWEEQRRAERETGAQAGPPQVQAEPIFPAAPAPAGLLPVAGHQLAKGDPTTPAAPSNGDSDDNSDSGDDDFDSCTPTPASCPPTTTKCPPPPPPPPKCPPPPPPPPSTTCAKPTTPAPTPTPCPTAPPTTTPKPTTTPPPTTKATTKPTTTTCPPVTTPAPTTPPSTCPPVTTAPPTTKPPPLTTCYTIDAPPAPAGTAKPNSSLLAGAAPEGSVGALRPLGWPGLKTPWNKAVSSSNNLLPSIKNLYKNSQTPQDSGGSSLMQYYILLLEPPAIARNGRQRRLAKGARTKGQGIVDEGSPNVEILFHQPINAR